MLIRVEYVADIIEVDDRINLTIEDSLHPLADVSCKFYLYCHNSIYQKNLAINTTMTVSIIVAFSQNFVIGKDNDIPWYIREDMKFFKEATMNKIVIMGRKTYESIPPQHRPLMGRTTYLLTRDPNYTVASPHVKIFHDFPKALFAAKIVSYDDEIMIAGGAEIYKQAMPHADKIYATVIMQDFEGDAFFKPGIEDWHIVDGGHDFHDTQLDLIYTRCVYAKRKGPYRPLA